MIKFFRMLQLRLNKQADQLSVAHGTDIERERHKLAAEICYSLATAIRHAVSDYNRHKARERQKLLEQDDE